jgi:hypothetical protein
MIENEHSGDLTDEQARAEIARFAAFLGEATAGGPQAPPPDDSAIRLAMAVDLCEFGSGPCGCGSGPPRLCSHPDHPDEVRRAYCLQCPVPRAG